MLRSVDGANAQSIALLATLRSAGIGCSEIGREAEGSSTADVLFVPGGLEIRSLLDKSGPGGVKVDVVNAIRSVFAAGGIIAAPCMGLAVALRSLSDVTSSLCPSIQTAAKPIVAFPALRILSTGRPLLGCTDAELTETMSMLVEQCCRLDRSTTTVTK